MGHEAAATIRERLAHWLEHLAHVLPAQAPIRDFVHHNTLHGFQHQPFAEALAAARRLTGAEIYWPSARFLAAYRDGRIRHEDLVAALNEAGVGGLDDPCGGGLDRRAALIAALLADDFPPSTASQGEPNSGGDALLARCRELVGAGRPAGENWRALAGERWQDLCARVGDDLSWRAVLEYLSGEDVLERVRTVLRRHLAAHLDLGLAAWRNPARGGGFYAAWRASAGLDLHWELDELPEARDEIQLLPDDPLAVLAEELPRLAPEAQWYGYIERLLLELPGWSGMFLWRAGHPEYGEVPVAMADYLAVRVLLERLLCDDLARRLSGAPVDELARHFAERPAEFYVRDRLRSGRLSDPLLDRAAALVERTDGIVHGNWLELATAIAGEDCSAGDDAAWRLAGLCRAAGLDAADLLTWSAADVKALLAAAAELSADRRGEIWLLAYERRYREQTFGALAANAARHRLPSAPPSAQVVMCMDDREEGTRRHLEEVAPAIETYGAAGFFGVAMYWQGLDDAQAAALCPVVVRPGHIVREHAAADAEGSAERHRERRERRLRWREQLYQATRRRPVAGLMLSALAAAPALAALTAASLAPAWFGPTLRRWRRQYEGRVPSALALTAPQAGAESTQAGFTDGEQVDRVVNFLRTIGLTTGFAPLVLLLGHGSASLNNPHRAAYDCGACSGRHGGPNARVFAAMANRPPVRAGLAATGIVIPETTWFVAAEHDTCDDSIEWYDLDAVPAEFQPALDTLVGQLAEACRAHAAERCRRLASAPPRLSPWQGLRHVLGRANDLSQARPELGHANNAAAFVGRRAMSRGLFLDRRAFLISYDPTADADGAIAESILLAAGPVGAGISLEYYFSSVDNERFGCGSKITHNVTGLFGVMAGADSDLRTGLPWQMVEIHEPMRLLLVVEQEPAVLDAILARQPALKELVGNAWVILAVQSPSTADLYHYRPGAGWSRWEGEAVLPQVARSIDWFAGEREALAPALLLGAPS